jgi:hypothetical protein
MTDINHSEELTTESLSSTTVGMEQSMADMTEQMAALTAEWTKWFK